MIKTIEIRNFKSIKNLTLNLGRINVFIGENGAGKSNILEAIALMGAASANKLDNEFLASRGIRVTSPHLMRQAFDNESMLDAIEIMVSNESETQEFYIYNDNKPYSKWEAKEKIHHFSTQLNLENISDITKSFDKFLDEKDVISDTGQYADLIKITRSFAEALESTSKQIDSVIEELEQMEIGDDEPIPQSVMDLEKRVSEKFVLPEVNEKVAKKFRAAFSTINKNISDFLIYSPENSSLKILEKEGQIEPLGVNGEGLLKFITFLSEYKKEDFAKVKQSLKLLGWFEDIKIEEEKTLNNVIRLKDKYIKNEQSFLEQLSVNEGFLFLLFYFSLFSSKLTPGFFAIDNIDSSLNPKLCEQLIKELSKLAVEYDKQVILTTHNPSVLDGLDLNSADQKLFMVSRSRNGHTRIKPVIKGVSDGNQPQRMSQLFISGALGGIPKRF